MKKESIRFVIWISVLVLFVEIFFISDDPGDFQGSERIPKPTVDYWQLFAGITQEDKILEEAGPNYRMPVFPPELVARSGDEVILSGYFLPYSKIDSVIILSRYPNASCFYCGLAGIESVAMVKIAENHPQFLMDQRLVVKGTLSLNNSDVNKLAFIIEDAIVEEL